MAAVVISGAVITKDDGRSGMYKEKCESCGYVSGTTKNFSSGGSGNSVMSSSFVCHKCKNRQDVKIKH